MLPLFHLRGALRVVGVRLLLIRCCFLRRLDRAGVRNLGLGHAAVSLVVARLLRSHIELVASQPFAHVARLGWHVVSCGGRLRLRCKQGGQDAGRLLRRRHEVNPIHSPLVRLDHHLLLMLLQLLLLLLVLLPIAQLGLSVGVLVVVGEG